MFLTKEWCFKMNILLTHSGTQLRRGTFRKAQSTHNSLGLMASSGTKTLARDPSCPIVGGRAGNSERGTEVPSTRLLVDEATDSLCMSSSSSEMGGLELLPWVGDGAAGLSKSSLCTGKLLMTQRVTCGRMVQASQTLQWKYRWHLKTVKGR